MKNKLNPYADIKNVQIEASFELTKEKIRISFLLQGDLKSYIFPKKENLQRVDELWKATCFELLLANDDELYYELNFSSSRWNFYVLDSYRAEPKELEIFVEPNLCVEQKNNEFCIIFELDISALNLEQFNYYNLATILLNENNERTFWAIKHLKTKPDFHDKKSFLEIT